MYSRIIFSKTTILIEKELLVVMVTHDVEAKVFGTFVLRHGQLFRTEAFIQWGDSTRTIGTVVLHHAGGTGTNLEWKEGEPKQLELAVDAQLAEIISILEEAYAPGMLNGRVYLYTLFSAVASNAMEAARLHKQLLATKDPLVYGFSRPSYELYYRLHYSEWVWLAWGCHYKSEEMREKIEQWLVLIHEVQTPIVGLRGDRDIDFYQPFIHSKNARADYRKALGVMLDELLLAKPTALYEQAWREQMAAAEPVEQLEVGPYRLALYNLGETEYTINYLYRLLVFKDGDEAPMLAFNYEQLLRDTRSLSVSTPKGHKVLKVLTFELSLAQFKAAVQRVLADYIKEPVELVPQPMGTVQLSLLQLEQQPLFVYDEAYEWVLCELLDALDVAKPDVVRVGNVEVQLVERQGQPELVSVLFNRAQWTLQQAHDWLERHRVYFVADGATVHGARILTVEQYGDACLVIAEQGQQELQVQSKEQKVQQKKAVIHKRQTKQKIQLLLNGQRPAEFQPMYFDRERDRIIANGYQIKADHIGLERGVLAFYVNELQHPIVKLSEAESIVNIELYEYETGAKTCIIEQRYAFEYLLQG